MLKGFGGWHVSNNLLGRLLLAGDDEGMDETRWNGNL
jgi:hypothetical protein